MAARDTFNQMLEITEKRKEKKKFNTIYTLNRNLTRFLAPSVPPYLLLTCFTWRLIGVKIRLQEILPEFIVLLRNNYDLRLFVSQTKHGERLILWEKLVNIKSWQVYSNVHISWFFWVCWIHNRSIEEFHLIIGIWEWDKQYTTCKTFTWTYI